MVSSAPQTLRSFPAPWRKTKFLSESGFDRVGDGAEDFDSSVALAVRFQQRPGSVGITRLLQHIYHAILCCRHLSRLRQSSSVLPVPSCVLVFLHEALSDTGSFTGERLDHVRARASLFSIMTAKYPASTLAFFALLFLLPLSAAPDRDPLRIPDTDEGLPGVGPLRRTEWFRGVWRSRRSSWLSQTEAQKNSIVFLGDSITQGWSDDFRGFFGDLKAINRGISGDTSRGLLLRLPEDVLALNPKAVVIMIGANDLAEKAKGETVFSNVKLIVKRLKEHSPTMPIIVCETFPCAPDDYRPVAEIQKINALYTKAWERDPQVTIAKTYELFAGTDGASLPKLLPDRVHPNTAGYAVWSNALHPVFSRLGLGDSTPDPHAWIHFNRYDREVARYNEFYIYYTNRGTPLELTMTVEPEPGHQLAFQWITKHGPIRSMTIEVNGRHLTRSHPSRGNGKQSFFWDTIPVTEFGITKRERKGNYKIRIWCPDGAEEDAVISSVRLISSESQLRKAQLARPTHKTTLNSPGSMSETEKASSRIDLDRARKQLQANWVGKKALSEEEIAGDAFLSAAVRFGDTVITRGRDIYGPVKSPMFVRFLHREKLRAPASVASMPPALGGASKPIVQTQFDRTQNLLRTLAGLSSATGNPKYAEAAMAATAHMFENYVMPHSGLIIFGNHMTIDLAEDRSYSDGRSGDVFELANVLPFYDFWYDVAPIQTERFIKGCWEVYVRDWHTMHYNRHASFNKTIDFSRTWHRPLAKVEDLPTNMEVLGFTPVGLDLAFGGYSLGCLQEDPKARAWGDRYLKVLSYHRDPKTLIWPMLLYTPTIRRNLEVYREAFPDADVTEPRVIISSWIYSMPQLFLGALAIIEAADTYGHAGELTESHQRINDWILGYMEAAYDRDTNTMRSIILDGTDVTDHVFEPDKVLHGWGAKEGDSFVAHPAAPGFYAALTRAYRLANKETRRRYWPLLRDLFKGVGLGDIGANFRVKPVLNLNVEVAEPVYVLALADLYRAHRRPEVLRLMEHLGHNIISRRQDPKSGLFSLHPDRIHTIRHNKKTKEPHEERTVRQTLRQEFGYDRPKVVALDVVDPLALLAVHACRTGQFAKIPQWLSGGQWGSDGSGHVINSDVERWFDRTKLESYYKKEQNRLKERGYAVGDEWYPN